MGVYCFSPRALEHIEPGKRLDFPDLVLRLLDARRDRPRAAQRRDYWLDIGRHDDYEKAHGGVRAHARPPDPARVTALEGRDIVCVGFADWDDRAVDQPAPPDVAASRPRQPRALRRVARACGARSSPAATSAGIARRLRRGLRAAARGRRRRPRALAAGAAAARQRRGARAQRAAAAAARCGAARRAGSGCERPMLWGYVPQAEALLDVARPVARRLPLRRRHRRAEGRRRRVSFRAAEERFAAPRRPRARQRAGAGRADARASPATSSTRPTSPTPSSSRPRCEPGRSTPRSTRCPRPRIVFTGAVVATKLDLGLLASARARCGPDWSIVARRAGRRSGTRGARRLARCERAPNVHLLGRAPLRGAARRAARRRRRR